MWRRQKEMSILLSLHLLLFITNISANNNGLGKTPQMGKLYFIPIEKIHSCNNYSASIRMEQLESFSLWHQWDNHSTDSRRHGLFWSCCCWLPIWYVIALYLRRRHLSAHYHLQWIWMIVGNEVEMLMVLFNQILSIFQVAYQPSSIMFIHENSNLVSTQVRKSNNTSIHSVLFCFSAVSIRSRIQDMCWSTRFIGVWSERCKHIC